MSEKLIRDVLIPLTVAFLFTVMTVISHPFAKLDRTWSDIALTSQDVPVSTDYLIVDITPEDAKEFGGLPLSRRVLADALDKLNQAGGAQILVDMAFSERLASPEDERFMLAMSKWGPDRLAVGQGTDIKFTTHATVVDLRLQPDSDGWTRAVQVHKQDVGINPSRWLAAGEHSTQKTSIDLRYDPSSFARINLGDVLTGQNLNATNKRIIISPNSALVPTRSHLPSADESSRSTIIALGSQSITSGFQAQFSKSRAISLVVAFLFTLLGIVFALIIRRKRLLFLVCFYMSIAAVSINVLTIHFLGGTGYPTLQYSCLLVGIFVAIAYRLRLMQMLTSFLKGDLSPEEAWAWRSYEHGKFPVILFTAMGSIRRMNSAATQIEPWFGENFVERCLNELRQGSDKICVLDSNGGTRVLSIERPNNDVPIFMFQDVTETSRKLDALENAVCTLQVSESIAVERADTFEENKRRAEEKSKLKSEFLANMSHELRTPLNAIIGFSNILNREMFGSLGDPRYKQFAGDILFSGQHLLSLINDILDLSKIEAGKMELSVDAVKLDVVIAQSIRMLEMRAKTAELRLIYQSHSLPQVMADSRAIKQVIINLMTNAIKFTPKGGVVQIQTEARAQDVVIHISDSGIGISEDDIERLGQPFEQINNKERKGQEGTGLGLSLSKSIVELHGGQFKITSVLGCGTTISFTVPYQQPESNIVPVTATQQAAYPQPAYPEATHLQPAQTQPAYTQTSGDVPPVQYGQAV